MYKGKNIYLNFIAFSVLLKKNLHKKSHVFAYFLLLCAGCETREYFFVLINGEYLSTIGKWTEGRQRRGGSNLKLYLIGKNGERKGNCI